MSPNPRHSIFILAMTLVPSVEAALYRCEAPDGSVVYQQTVCAGETRGGEVQVDTRPPGGSSAGASGRSGGGTDYSVESQLKAMEAAHERERKERQRDAKSKAPPRERDTRDPAACARHRAEAVRWRETIRNGYRSRDERDYQRHKLEYHQTLVRRYCGED
jgi:hypothetical protein